MWKPIHLLHFLIYLFLLIFSFLNSCVNPVALYCVSGVFRQHFHRYLCCKQITPPNRLGLSTATGGNDTSYMSTIRRPNHHHGYSSTVSNGNSTRANGNSSAIDRRNNGDGSLSPTQSVMLSEKRWGTVIITQDTFLWFDMLLFFWYIHVYRLWLWCYHIMSMVKLQNYVTDFCFFRRYLFKLFKG